MKFVNLDYKRVGLHIKYLLLLILSIQGCQNLPTVESRRVLKGNTPRVSDSQKSNYPDDDYEDTIDQPPINDDENQSGEPGTTDDSKTSQTRTLPPEPKIGVIVGPGFLRSFIALGILQEFQRERIPIHALTGLEWGSLPAGLLALNGQANEMEWQMLKLNESSLIKKSLIRNQIEPQSTTELRDFLNSAFDKKSFEQSKIPFECLTYDLKKKQYFWMKKGDLATALTYCLSSPPFSRPYLNNVGAMNLKLAADSLRRKGANFIVFINTISAAKNLLDDKFSPEAQVLWSLHQYHLASSKGVVDFVIETSSAPYSILDFSSRRDMIRAGQDIGAKALKKLATRLKI